jgi:hypothetical protein
MIRRAQDVSSVTDGIHGMMKSWTRSELAVHGVRFVVGLLLPEFILAGCEQYSGKDVVEASALVSEGYEVITALADRRECIFISCLIRYSCVEYCQKRP